MVNVNSTSCNNNATILTLLYCVIMFRKVYLPFLKAESTIQVNKKHKEGLLMKISGRNKLEATVKEVVKGAVMAKVVMDHKGTELVAAITVDSAEELNLVPGDKVTALVKATEMMVLK